MKKWNKFVQVDESDFHLFSQWTAGSLCSATGKRKISVKAYVHNGVARLAEKNIPGIKYGTIFKVKS